MINRIDLIKRDRRTLSGEIYRSLTEVFNWECPMDVELLSRLQFALTIGFHYIYPPLSIGLGVIMVVVESFYMWTRLPFYRNMAKFWTRVFALTFSLGVATGIVMEFEFGTNWSKYSHFVGDVFGSALGAEGIFAFFLESGFLALLLFGWDRVSDRLHYFSTWMVALGAHFSAVWIVVANSWMQTPVGYHLVETDFGIRAEITEFWTMVFNPSSLDRLSHVILGCWLSGAFLVLSISAWYFLKGRHEAFARFSAHMASIIALVSLTLSLLTGHHSAKTVATYQPTKLAAMEGIFETQSQAPLTLAGYVDTTNEKVVGIKAPGMLSWLLYGDTQATVTGLNEFDQSLWPPIALTFTAYHIMVSLWGLMFGTALLGLILFKKGALSHWKRLALWLCIFSVSFPIITNQVGWIVAEVGRQPWIVWGLLKTKDALSPQIQSQDVLASLILFTIIYILLFALFISLLNQKIQAGPKELPESANMDEYRNPYNRA